MSADDQIVFVHDLDRGLPRYFIAIVQGNYLGMIWSCSDCKLVVTETACWLAFVVFHNHNGNKNRYKKSLLRNGKVYKLVSSLQVFSYPSKSSSKIDFLLIKLKSKNTCIYNGKPALDS